ncbi:MAG: phage tail tube protein [Pseudonocardiaceae bacterium]
MATGSGLDAQLGVIPEVTWGTPLTPTRFYEFNTESVKRDYTWLEPTGLRVGTKYKRASRARVSRQSVSGDFELEWATKGMGLLVAQMLASGLTTTTQILATTAYKQIHTPGDFRGKGMTLQIGRPEPATGTVRPFTMTGCKVGKWDFSLKDNAIPTLKLTVDGKSETTATALAVASYLTGATVFDFSQATLKLGGTASTAAGETTISSGVAVATIIKDITISGAAPMATDRFGIGNAGLKSEQLENATPTITGKMSAEFGKAELYDQFSSQTAIPLQLDLNGAQIGSSGNNFLLSFILPAVKFKAAPPQVSGPGVVMMATDFEVYSDEVNPVIQIKIQSDEATSV